MDTNLKDNKKQYAILLLHICRIGILLVDIQVVEVCGNAPVSAWQCGHIHEHSCVQLVFEVSACVIIKLNNKCLSSSCERSSCGCMYTLKELSCLLCTGRSMRCSYRGFCSRCRPSRWAALGHCTRR